MAENVLVGNPIRSITHDEAKASTMPLVCCICSDLIAVEEDIGWKWGYNADPVVKGGRCCARCDSEFVMKRRILESVGIKVEKPRFSS